MQITIEQLENNIKTLPENLYQQVNDFVDFLRERYDEESDQDWSEKLSSEQKESIVRGMEDIENGSTFTNSQALQRIRHHRDQKNSAEWK